MGRSTNSVKVVSKAYLEGNVTDKNKESPDFWLSSGSVKFNMETVDGVFLSVNASSNPPLPAHL